MSYLPEAYRDEIIRMIDDAIRLHEKREKEREPCNGEWTSEFLPEDEERI